MNQNKWIVIGSSVVCCIMLVMVSHFSYLLGQKHQAGGDGTGTPNPEAITAEGVRQIVNEMIDAKLESSVSAKITVAVDQARTDADQKAAERQEMQRLTVQEILKQFTDVRHDVETETFRSIRENAALRGAILTGQTILVSTTDKEDSPASPSTAPAEGSESVEEPPAPTVESEEALPAPPSSDPDSKPEMLELGANPARSTTP